MQRPAVLRLLVLSILVAAITACGGGNNNSIGPPATVTLTPATLSLNVGSFSSVVAVVKDASDRTNQTAPVTMESSNPAVATVLVRTTALPGGGFATSGIICAGTWDTAGVVCTPGPAGTANITATAGGITSAATVVTTHQRISRIDISPTSLGCVSQAGTQQFTAVVRDTNGADITSAAGALTWTSSDTTVATIDANGLLTAAKPGASQVTAGVGGVVSQGVTFVTCPPAEIFIANSTVVPTETSFTLASGGTKQLSFAATDTHGNPIGNPGLTWTSSNTGVATVSTSGLVTAVGAGTTEIVASCTPTSCNNGVNQPIFSNVVTVTVSGTLTSTVYATGANATSVVPIDPATNAAGTPITIPPTSIPSGSTQPVLINGMFSRDGTRLFLGSNVALYVFNTSTNTFISSSPGVPGRVLAVASNGRVAVADPVLAGVRIFDPGTSQVTNTIDVSTPVAAAFTPDSSKIFIAGAAGITVFSMGNTRLLSMSEAPKDVTIIDQGSAAYVAGGAPSTLGVFATCNNSHLNDVAGISSTPLLVKASDNATRVFAVDNARMYEVGVGLVSIGCPPNVTSTLTASNFGVGTFTPRQLIVKQDGSGAFVLSDLARVLAYNATTDAPTSINLVGGATSALSGGVLPDGSQVYVGAAGTNDVHRIDVNAGTDAQQIPVNLKKTDNSAEAPSIVAVRPR